MALWRRCAELLKATCSFAGYCRPYVHRRLRHRRHLRCQGGPALRPCPVALPIAHAVDLLAGSGPGGAEAAMVASEAELWAAGNGSHGGAGVGGAGVGAGGGGAGGGDADNTLTFLVGFGVLLLFVLGGVLASVFLCITLKKDPYLWDAAPDAAELRLAPPASATPDADAPARDAPALDADARC
ncbi:hypothetical protein R5R35_002576 [Gryllus longicercus]|uniref:Uncharacterized protein n=1 Tax=Gryllus longicercus TaxID=2509291 RepID=A0AAN9VVQ8_9ORTH